MNTLIAKKVGMTQIFDENSAALGVTVLDVSDCRIVQVKSEDKDGYDAVQLTIGTAKNVNKPISEHYKKYNVEPGQGLYEVPTDPDSGLESGMQINVIDFFEIGQKVDITGYSKGHGFTGVMKRHNFKGQKASHGVHKVHRAEIVYANYGLKEDFENLKSKGMKLLKIFISLLSALLIKRLLAALG